MLTRQAIEAGLAPITPHLYMTQCLNEDKPEERAAGMAAGIEVVNADKLRYKLEYDRRQWLDEYARLHACEFCGGSRLHTCTGCLCLKPYKEAYE